MSPLQDAPTGQFSHSQSCLINAVLFKYSFSLQSDAIFQSGLMQSVCNAFGSGLMVGHAIHLVASVALPWSSERERYWLPSQSIQPLPLMLLNLPASQD